MVIPCAGRKVGIEDSWAHRILGLGKVGMSLRIQSRPLPAFPASAFCSSALLLGRIPSCRHPSLLNESAIGGPGTYEHGGAWVLQNADYSTLVVASRAHHCARPDRSSQ